jgi:DNA-binding MarR family transcriptional regulator
LNGRTPNARSSSSRGLVRLTRRGRRTADAALETHVAGEEHLLGALSQAERRTLDGLLRKLLQALDDPSRPSH